MTDMLVYTRSGGPDLEGFEKAVPLPAPDDADPARHAWADARFATDIMAEHALFFAMLMPPEVAPEEREEALRFSRAFADLHATIDTAGPPEGGELRQCTQPVIEAIKPFIDYKAEMGEAQSTGRLHSLVWPLFFDHTRHEAERWTRRLDQVGAGESEFDKEEVASFWDNIMDEHARFVAHLLDPDEFELIEKAMSTSKVFRELGAGGVLGATKALAKEPGTVAKALAQFPETSAVLSAAETILDFKTQAARDIEGGRIKSTSPQRHCGSWRPMAGPAPSTRDRAGFPRERARSTIGATSCSLKWHLRRWLRGVPLAPEHVSPWRWWCSAWARHGGAAGLRRPR